VPVSMCLWRHLTLAIVSSALALTPASAEKAVQQESSRFEWVSKDYRNAAYPLTRLINLLVKGSSLIDRKVTVVGVLSVEFEDVNLYLTKEAYAYLNVSNAVALNLTTAQVSAIKAKQGQYVEVSGKVVADPSARVDASVRIEEITRVALGGPMVPRQ
jgi:hypothetical protein